MQAPHSETRKVNRLRLQSRDLRRKKGRVEKVSNEEIRNLLMEVTETISTVSEDKNTRRLQRILKLWGGALFRRKNEEINGRT